MPRVQPPHGSTAAPGASPPGSAKPSPDEVAETNELVLELIHAAHGARDPDSAEAHGRGETRLSAHAVRAAVHVHQRGARTIGELARGLGISYGWASRIASELEAEGIVRRLADPEDRRIVRVAIDPAAAEVVDRAYRWRGSAIQRALEPLAPDERIAVRRFLRLAAAELAGSSSPIHPRGDDPG